ALEVEGQPVFGAARKDMEVAADREKKIFRARELAKFPGRQESRVRKRGGGADAVVELADPEQGVEIAKPTLAYLHIGLDDIARIAQPLVSLIALGELFGHEGTGIACDDLRIETRRGMVIKAAVAPDEARLDERGPDCQVILCRADHLVDRARRVADLQPEIPQRVELRLDHLFSPARLLERRHEADVDVAVRRHLAATVTANGDHRDPLARRAVASRIEMLGGEIMAETDDLIDQEGGRIGCDAPCRGLLEEAALDLGTPGFECLFE